MKKPTTKTKTAKKSIEEICKTVEEPNYWGNPEYRMLSRDFFVLNDTHKTRLNNNDLIVGAAGRGKSTGYVEPLIDQMCSNMIISDTKNALYRNHADKLRAAGYKVYNLDFSGSPESCSYNPLDFIGYDEESDSYCQQDIITLAEQLCPGSLDNDKFWPMSAQILISALIAFILEATPEHEHNFGSLLKLFLEMDNIKTMDRIFSHHGMENPKSFAYARYRMFKSVGSADRTFCSIMIFAAASVSGFDCSDKAHVFNRKSSFTFEQLANEKTAVFLNTDDTDRSLDKIVNIFYSQAFNKLIKIADKTDEKRLAIPVRFILDDFATNTVIPYFSKLISVIRSREIYVSIILQGINQLKEIYSEAEATTIICNCDHMLFLGASDIETARYIGEKMNTPYYNILNLPFDAAYLFEAGNPKGGMKVEKYIPDFSAMGKVVE
ncbi:Type IV secretory system Conjugative DNA transfer [Lachnospiraceae bacterium NE2001]|nr:Type IV secretory system Conjugative DNA transfer [Lachnospiraceae bacterium NE2001]